MFKNIKLHEDPDQRMNRGKTQRIYLANRNVDDNSAQFEILGTTGNVYTVKLSGSPTCTCPDFSQRKKRCKHIFFMLAKIFNVTDPHKEKFTKTEIVEYIEKYKINISKFIVKYDIKQHCIDVGAKCVEDNCAICLDEILNGEQYVYCKKSCGRCVHNDCYNVVIKKTSKCPYCAQNFVCSSLLGNEDEIGE